jgi:dipeptidyl aminopeptidase/acylaminoacyl peptidase
MRRLAIDDLSKLRWIGDIAISPNGRAVAYALETIVERAGAHDGPRQEYRSHIWVVDIDSGAARQFTAGDHRGRRPRWSPDGARILFTSDRGSPGSAESRPAYDPAGDKKPTHLWVIPAAGGEARRVTEADHGPAETVWSPDGTQIAFSGKAAQAQPATDVKIITRMKHKFDGEGFWDNRYKHIFVVPSAGGSARQLTSGDFDHRQPAWSHDGSWLAFVANRTEDADYTNVADIWVLTPSGGEPRCITRGLGPVSSPAWSPDGTMIAYLGHDNVCVGASNTTLWLVPSDGSAAPRALTQHYDRSLIHHVLSDMRAHPTAGEPVWSHDGRFVFVMVADGGTTQLAAVDVTTGSVRLMTSGRREIYGESYDAGRRRVAMATSDHATPGDIWIGQVDGLEQGQPVISAERRLTAVNQGVLDEVTLSTPERFTYRGADDWTIEGWIVPPVGLETGKRYPAILSIHGGPHFAYGDAFFFEFQIMAALGYAVVLTNPRGSQGYGQMFTAATHHDWGGKDYGDIMDGLEAALARYPYLDRDRLGVAGGSYGGYMTNWIIGHTSRFKAAVTMRSIANCLSQWGTSDMAYFKGYWEFPGDPWDNPMFYWEKSPLAYVNDITTPLLIEHSENDLRCPISEGEQLFAALKKQGKEVIFVRFPNETHDLTRHGQPAHRIERLRLVMDWFTKHIPPVALPAQAEARLAGAPAGDGTAADGPGA